MKPENLDDLEQEFPFLVKLRERRFLVLLDLLQFFERKLRKFIYWGTIILIVYVAFSRLQSFFVTGNLKSAQFFPAPRDLVLGVWITYRNFFYLFATLDFPLMIISASIEASRNRMGKVVKICLSWFGLLIFVTFSYAIAGLITDFVFFFMYLHKKLLEQNGISLETYPFNLLR